MMILIEGKKEMICPLYYDTISQERVCNLLAMAESNDNGGCYSVASCLDLTLH